MYFLLVITVLLKASVLAQGCKPLDFGQGSVVCECNSTYCDYYVDPNPPSKGVFMWYVTSKSGMRLKYFEGKISNVSHNGYVVLIKPRQEYQTMEGFGGAFTDSAGFNINKLSPKTQENLLRSYFDADGIKYNLGRVPIGGTDFSLRPYTYDDVDNDIKLKQFTLAKEDFQYKIPYMKRASKLNPSLRFVASAWTAPPWMKNKHQFNGYTYLLEKYYQTYANYIIKFLEEYKKQGLNIWTITTGNEPLSSLVPNFPIDSMYWSWRSVTKWVINNLGPTLQKSMSNETEILMLDDQRLNLPWFALDIKYKHSDVLKFVKGIAVHWYWDAVVPAVVLDMTHKLIPDKFILMTEACVGSHFWDKPKVILGSWTRAESIAYKMFENINHWVVGWIDWNLALNTAGGPNWINNNVDAPIIVVPEADVFYKQPMFYILAHFSKFVPRSSIKIGTKSENKNILSTAFKTKDNQIVVVLYNSNNKKTNVSIVDENVGSINIELLEHSMHTILYSNA